MRFRIIDHLVNLSCRLKASFYMKTEKPNTHTQKSRKKNKKEITTNKLPLLLCIETRSHFL